MFMYSQLRRKITIGWAHDPGVSLRLRLQWVYRCWLEDKIKTVKMAQVEKEQFSPARNNRFVSALMFLMLQGGHSPVRIHGTHARRGAAWHRSPALGTSCHCRSPEWSLPQLWEPCRRHSAGMDSCSAGKLAGQGCLGTRKKSARNFIGQYCAMTVK